MKKVHITRAIGLLIIVVLIWQYVEKRNDLQCYVLQLASRHEFVFKAGYASEDEIRDIVFNDTVADFHGQMWRASLDQIFQAIFMGGNRGKQVVALLLNPPDDLPDFSCEGSIEWTIWYNPDFTVLRNYTGTGIKSLHHVTTALQAIPQEELRQYEVAADLTYYSGSWNEGNTAWSGGSRDAGSVSAREWLNGKIVPDYWSGWYAAWLEQWQKLQDLDDE